MALFAAATAAPHRRAQSAEPSPWDAIVYPLLDACGHINKTIEFNQKSTTTVELSYSGFTPQMVWLTDAAGTIVAFSNNTDDLPSPVTLSWEAHLAKGSEPLSLLPHAIRTIPTNDVGQSCEEVTPTDREASPTWRKLYLDATTTCCKAKNHTTAQLQAHEQTITVDYAAQTFSVSSPSCAPVLNYVYADPSGELLQVKTPQACGGGGYTSGNVAFPPLATSLTACASMSEDGVINPICAEHDLVGSIVASLEDAAPVAVTDPTTRDSQVAVSYGGASGAPTVTFAITAACGGSAFYLRLGSTAAAVDAFVSANSLTMQLDSSGSIYLYRCCGALSVQAGQASPVQCATGTFHRYTFDAATLSTQAENALQSTLSTPNTYQSLEHVDSPTACVLPTSSVVATSSSAPSAPPASPAISYPQGYWYIDATNGKNCTCSQGAFSCKDPPSTTDTVWTSGQVALVATLATIGGLVVIAVLILAVLRGQRSTMKPSMLPRIETIPNPTGAQLERERL